MNCLKGKLITGLFIFTSTFIVSAQSVSKTYKCNRQGHLYIDDYWNSKVLSHGNDSVIIIHDLTLGISKVYLIFFHSNGYSDIETIFYHYRHIRQCRRHVHYLDILVDYNTYLSSKTIPLFIELFF